MEITLSTI